MADIDLELREMARRLHPDQLYELVDDLPQDIAQALLDEFGARGAALDLPLSPLVQAQRLMDRFAARPHLAYLSERIAQAVKDVENGQERRLIVEMPPRSGKSLLATQVTPGWILAAHPTWDIMLTSYSRNLATSWGRQIRRWVTEGGLGDHLQIAPDAGAVENWETSDGGKIAARSVGSDLTGFGAKVLVIDDPHKNFAEAHSEESRKRIWNWWLSDVQTRLQPPSLVIVIMTRWHEDDLVGRLLSAEFEGDPADWEVIRLPAIAEKADVLGREEGDPLYSPLIEETRAEALLRWEQVKRGVGTYSWSALYQQRPAPVEGAIFSTEWWRYWTRDPALASYLPDGTPDPNGKVVLFNPETEAGGQWLDSWDATFKGTASSDYVVGQRWVKLGANRYLIAQQRERWTFTETLAAMEAWGKAESERGTGRLVHKRVVEDKANGPAILDTLKSKIAGLKAINPTTSKEARARAVTPEIESGNVLLPNPAEPGNEWVADFISEVRNFPNDAHDDQVDALSQALRELRDEGVAGVAVPGTQEPTPRGLSIPGGRGGGFSAATRVETARTMGRR